MSDTVDLDKIQLELADSLFASIAHGDDRHRAWLKTALLSWFETNAVVLQWVAETRALRKQLEEMKR